MLDEAFMGRLLDDFYVVKWAVNGILCIFGYVFCEFLYAHNIILLYMPITIKEKL